MNSFFIGIVVLIWGYFLYGAFLSRVKKIDSKRLVPAYEREDGVDFVPLPT